LITHGVSRRRCLQGLGAAALVSSASLVVRAAEGVAAATSVSPTLPGNTPTAGLLRPGSLLVGLYNDMPPFHTAGQGIDVEIAQALAAELGLKPVLMPFAAGENMQDDLRNMVWKGHYLGYGPADVLLHVPVERALMDSAPQVSILGPYYREHLVAARNLEKLPTFDTLASIKGLPVAVAGQTLAGWLMIGADGGAYRDQLLTKWSDGTEAARALLQGDVAVAVGMSSEIEAVVRSDPRFAIAPLPVPRAPRDGWAIGVAVKSGSTELARSLQAGMNTLKADGRIAAIFARHAVSWRPV